MPDEIYVNTGTSFQQPFNDRTPNIVTTAVDAQRVAQAATNTQQPYPYTANAQQSYTANAQQPYPYIANQPTTYPYIANSQTSYIANKQTPFPYIANRQVSYQAAEQQPYPYTAVSQTPYIANAQQPYPYTANNQQPYIANAQQPYPYIANTDTQTPSIANRQTPYPYTANAQATYTANSQTPYPYIANQPTTYPYIANSRQPSIVQVPTIAQQSYTANAQQPYPYTASAQATYTASAQQPYPYTANAQASYTANAQQAYSYTASAQTPSIVNGQTPFIYSTQTSISSRTPYAYAAWLYHAHGSTGTPINHASEVNISTSDTVQVYVWCTYNGNDIEVYASRSNQGTGFVKKDTGLSYTLSDNENVKIGTLEDAGTGYKVRFVAGSFYDVTDDESGEPAVIPVLQSSNMTNTTSTTGGNTILSNKVLWTASQPNYVRLRVSAQPGLEDETGSASAAVNIVLHFDKSGSTAFNYPITLYGELEIDEEEEGGFGE